uniref:(northern house mosquito) hypothetical protein n=1 Tax=Culex pipiens TaxID=7175 RepID=A0A8D8BN84_CULPI
MLLGIRHRSIVPVKLVLEGCRLAGETGCSTTGDFDRTFWSRMMTSLSNHGSRSFDRENRTFAAERFRFELATARTPPGRRTLGSRWAAWYGLGRRIEGTLLHDTLEEEIHFVGRTRY